MNSSYYYYCYYYYYYYYYWEWFANMYLALSEKTDIYTLLMIAQDTP